MLVYLNGKFVPREQAAISVDDRGFLFGDSLYEVIRSYNGFFFEREAHLRRLRNGLEALRIHVREFDRLEEIACRLIADNGLAETDATIYFQITRGAPATRKHAFPDPEVPPTVYVATNPLKLKSEWAENGIAVITISDLRWGRCDLKTTNLLPNVLANQQAHEAGAEEAILVRKGMVVEGSHSNVFAVLAGVVVTHPNAPVLLPGITRKVAIDLCRQLHLPIEEKPISRNQFQQAEEVFLTLTTAEMAPVVRIDGKVVGNGQPGAITRRLQQAFAEYVRAARERMTSAG